MPAPPEPVITRASWRSIALHFVLGAFIGYVLSIVFIEGRGWSWGRRRGRLYLPIVDADESMLFMIGMEILVGGLVALRGDDLWSTDAFMSKMRLSLQHTPESARWTRRTTWFGASLVAFALVRSWI